MTADEFRKKSRSEMAKEGTQRVKVGRFIVTSHAQNRMIERDIPNEAMIRNLVKKASARSPTVYDSRGQPSYKRHNRESTTIINPSAKTVATIYPLKKSEAKRYGIDRTHLMTETELRRSRASSSKPKARRTVKRSASSRVSVKRTAVKRTSTGRSSGKRKSR